jgi:hypothetical protein
VLRETTTQQRRKTPQSKEAGDLAGLSQKTLFDVRPSAAEQVA